jgi:hypothetical protein
MNARLGGTTVGLAVGITLAVVGTCAAGAYLIFTLMLKVAVPISLGEFRAEPAPAGSRAS